MASILRQAWQEDDGVLSFEWVLLVTLLAIGIVSGLAATRDAFIDELADIAEAVICLDQSYTIAPTAIPGGFIAAEFTDEKAEFADCDRVLP